MHLDKAFLALRGVVCIAPAQLAQELQGGVILCRVQRRGLEGLDQPLQMCEPAVAQGRGHARDNPVESAIRIPLHRLPRAFRQRDRVQRGAGSNLADLSKRIGKDGPHVPLAVVHPIHDRRGKR